MTTTEKPKYVHYDRHEDDEWFDEVKIEPHIRWKESELSGDEYRMSYTVTFFRKGIPLVRKSFSRLQWALAFVPSMNHSMAPAGNDDKLEEKAPELLMEKVGVDNFNELCFQPGCQNLATLEYKKVRDWCNKCGHDKDIDFSEKHRRFCGQHKQRGDCGLDDADVNYVLVGQRVDGVWHRVGDGDA